MHNGAKVRIDKGPGQPPQPWKSYVYSWIFLTPCRGRLHE